MLKRLNINCQHVSNLEDYQKSSILTLCTKYYIAIVMNALEFILESEICKHILGAYVRAP